MGRILLVATPLFGHLGPLLTIGQALHRAGHAVEVLTGAQLRSHVERAGLTFRSLPSEAAVGTVTGAGDRRFGPRWRAARHDVIARFVAPLRAQAAAIESLLASRGPYAAVLADTAFLGVLPLLLAPTAGAGRPPIVGVSMTPISYLSSDAAPFGSGLRHSDSHRARQRNRRINWLLQRGPLRPIQEALHDALRPWQIPRSAVNYFNVVGLFDTTFQLGLPELEYPRRELPSSVRCIGPVPVFSSTPPPPWLDRLDAIAAGRPVVHVTQGTLDNSDLDRLIVPTIRGLAGRDVLVVAATGGGRFPTGYGAGSAAESRGDHRSPDILSADFVPYEQLLPRIDLMITNGGWGGIQQAARHGIPLIVAGDTEEKPETAARVEWAGLGLDLQTGRPSPARLGEAAEAVLGDDVLRARMQSLSRAVDQRPDPVLHITTAVDQLVSAGQSVHSVGVTALDKGRRSAGWVTPAGADVDQALSI